MPRLADPDPFLPPLALLAQATAAGLTPDQVRHRVRSRRWERVGRGAYLTVDEAPEDLDDYARARVAHVQRALAAAHRNPGTVVGYASAALLHVMPVLGRVPTDVTLVVPPGHWTGRRSGIIFRRLRLSDDHVERRRVPVTTPVRTWLDIACRGSLADALAAGDGGIRSGLLTSESVAGVLGSIDVLPGLQRARRAAPLLNGLRETALESASYAYMVEHRLPLPRLQVTITDERGFVGRVDVLWDDLPSGRRVVGESDGVVKYGTSGEAYREKVREDRLRAAGYQVVRWGFRDLRTPDLARRLRELLMS